MAVVAQDTKVSKTKRCNRSARLVTAVLVSDVGV